MPEPSVLLYDPFQDSLAVVTGGQRLGGKVGERKRIFLSLVEMVALPDQFNIVFRFLVRGDDVPEVSYSADASG